MTLTKPINDLLEFESDVTVLMKAEKNPEYKRFLEMLKINASVLRNKLQYFFENANEYTKELEKELEKEDRKSSKNNR